MIHIERAEAKAASNPEFIVLLLAPRAAIVTDSYPIDFVPTSLARRDSFSLLFTALESIEE